MRPGVFAAVFVVFRFAEHVQQLEPRINRVKAFAFAAFLAVAVIVLFAAEGFQPDLSEGQHLGAFAIVLVVTITGVGDKDLLHALGIASTHGAACEVEQALADLERAQQPLQGQRATGQHRQPHGQPGRAVAERGNALGHRGQPFGHTVGDRPDRIAHRAHGVVHRLRHFLPFLRRGFAALSQVLVEDAAGFARFALELAVQFLVLHVGRERGLDLHVGKDIAGAQGLLQ